MEKRSEENSARVTSCSFSFLHFHSIPCFFSFSISNLGELVCLYNQMSVAVSILSDLLAFPKEPHREQICGRLDLKGVRGRPQAIWFHPQSLLSRTPSLSDPSYWTLHVAVQGDDGWPRGSIKNTNTHARSSLSYITKRECGTEVVLSTPHALLVAPRWYKKRLGRIASLVS